MEFFKATEEEYGSDVFIRHPTTEGAEKILETFKKVRPEPKLGPLKKIGWWEGKKAFYDIPEHHDIIWPGFDTEMYRCSGKSNELTAELCA